MAVHTVTSTYTAKTALLPVQSTEKVFTYRERGIQIVVTVFSAKRTHIFDYIALRFPFSAYNNRPANLGS